MFKIPCMVAVCAVLVAVASLFAQSNAPKCGNRKCCGANCSSTNAVKKTRGEVVSFKRLYPGTTNMAVQVEFMDKEDLPKRRQGAAPKNGQ